MAKTSTRKTTRRRTAAPPEPIGLRPKEARAKPPGYVEQLCQSIEADGGSALTAYREPLGGKWVVLAVLPLEQVQPTPYQRGLSDTHVKRLCDVIARTGRYLDPIIAVRIDDKSYQTPNGHHRASALRMQGARSITALVVTEPEIARLILALNVEKAHNLRDKCLEVIRLARDLAELPGLREKDLSLEFEDPAFLTLGLCYDQRGRFAGGAYHPILKRVDKFVDRPLPRSLEMRQTLADRVLEIDDRVTQVVQTLKEQGLVSPYLRNFVVARINPLRFQRGAKMAVEETLEKMAQAAERFKPDNISSSDLARSGGAAGSDS